MRLPRIATLLVLTLLVCAAPLALATGEEHAEKGRARAEEARAERALRANETDDDNATRPEHAAAKGRSDDAPKGVLAGFRASLQALREALRLDMAGVREGCHAAERDADATQDGHRAWAHCMRDGYHKLFDAFRMERGGLRDQMRATHA